MSWRGGDGGGSELEARSTGAHCGEKAKYASLMLLICTSLLATLGFVMCGLKAAQQTAATPMRTSARKQRGQNSMTDFQGSCLMAVAGSVQNP